MTQPSSPAYDRTSPSVVFASDDDEDEFVFPEPPRRPFSAEELNTITAAHETCGGRPEHLDWMLHQLGLYQPVGFDVGPYLPLGIGTNVAIPLSSFTDIVADLFYQQSCSQTGLECDLANAYRRLHSLDSEKLSQDFLGRIIEPMKNQSWKEVHKFCVPKEENTFYVQSFVALGARQTEERGYILDSAVLSQRCRAIGFDDSEVRSVLNLFDKDSDGQVDFDEYKRILAVDLTDFNFSDSVIQGLQRLLGLGTPDRPRLQRSKSLFEHFTGAGRHEVKGEDTDSESSEVLREQLVEALNECIQVDAEAEKTTARHFHEFYTQVEKETKESRPRLPRQKKVQKSAWFSDTSYAGRHRQRKINFEAISAYHKERNNALVPGTHQGPFKAAEPKYPSLYASVAGAYHRDAWTLPILVPSNDTKLKSVKDVTPATTLFPPLTPNTKKSPRKEKDVATSLPATARMYEKNNLEASLIYHQVQGRAFGQKPLSSRLRATAPSVVQPATAR